MTPAAKSVLSALEKEDLQTIKRLLTSQPNLFQLELQFGWPLPHLCLARSTNKPCFDFDLTKLWVDRGGDVNQNTYRGTSLLYLAAMADACQTMGIAEYLKSLGARMSTFEKTAVMIHREDQSMVLPALRELLEQEPGLVYALGHGGLTLLHHAVCSRKGEAVLLLLERGADPNAVTFHGASPLMLASDGESTLEL